MKKKLLAILIACVVLVSCIVPSAGAASKKFTDVKDGDWYKSAVESVVEKGDICRDVGDDLFSACTHDPGHVCPGAGQFHGKFYQAAGR